MREKLIVGNDEISKGVEGTGCGETGREALLYPDLLGFSDLQIALL